jgi:hypothetical protein
MSIIGRTLMVVAAIGPVVCWWLGMGNPIGYMGMRPWDPRVKAARAHERNRA